MNNQSEALLEELILKHNFIVQVSPSDEDETMLIVTFAGRKNVYYRLVIDEEGEIYGIAYARISENDSEAIEEYIPMMKSTIRLFILLDIYRQCRELGLSLEIVRFIKGENITDLVNILPISMDEYEQKDEKILNEAIELIMGGNVVISQLNEKLEQCGLLMNFHLLKGLL